jgi:hypothetical protein
LLPGAGNDKSRHPFSGKIRESGTDSGLRQVEIKEICLMALLAEVLQNG